MDGQHHLESRSGIKALEWVPRVDAHQVEEFETLARADGYGDYRISEKDSGGDWIPVSGREA